MRNKLYYILFVLYVAMVVFICYINGVFHAGFVADINFLINIVFLIFIGIMFIISAVSFGRLNNCTAELVEATYRMQEEYKRNSNKSIWSSYAEKKDVFANPALKQAFIKYQARMKGYRNRHGYSNVCDIDEFINEDLLDRVGMNFFNSGISGTMTGLGILGTFLGLSMGLSSFSGENIYTISDNVGPLLSGMKVAFHTSVYGIFFSLVFNFVYRSIMQDAYEKLENFQNAFKQFSMPEVASADEHAAAIAIYQANMANTLKQILEYLKGNATQQTAGVEQIVDKFLSRMDIMMGDGMREMGSAMQAAAQAQTLYTDNCRELLTTANALVEMNKDLQAALQNSVARQERFAEDLEAQKDKLYDTCGDICDEVSNQLYALGQARGLYEK